MGESSSDSDAYQEAFHRAFEGHLGRIINDLPIRPDDRGIDVPSGNGFYSVRLAPRIGVGGQLIVADSSDEFLAECRRRLDQAPTAATVSLQKADAYHLPFAAASFNFVWCAQSLITLDPVPAVREMRRVVKDDGFVAILEGDEYHHVVLPWPVELEAALPLAIHEATIRRFGDAAKLSPARRLRHVLQECGFQTIERQTYTADRATPFDDSTRTFLKCHVRHLRSLAYPHLSKPHREMFDRLTDPDEADSLYRRPDAELLCINIVYRAWPRSRAKAP